MQSAPSLRGILPHTTVCALPLLFYMIWLVATVVVALFMTVAPFVQEQVFRDRLLISSGVSLALIPVVACAHGGWSGLRRHGWKNIALASCGLTLFTWLAAELSPNTPWLLSQVLPSVPFEQRVTVVDAMASGSTFRRLNLTFLDSADQRPRYVALSRRSFALQPLSVGDIVVLRGRRGPLGMVIVEVAK